MSLSSPSGYWILKTWTVFAFEMYIMARFSCKPLLFNRLFKASDSGGISGKWNVTWCSWGWMIPLLVVICSCLWNLVAISVVDDLILKTGCRKVWLFVLVQQPMIDPWEKILTSLYKQDQLIMHLILTMKLIIRFQKLCYYAVREII